jgi:hypothetical protein
MVFLPDGSVYLPATAQVQTSVTGLIKGGNMGQRHTNGRDGRYKAAALRGDEPRLCPHCRTAVEADRTTANGVRAVGFGCEFCDPNVARGHDGDEGWGK